MSLVRFRPEAPQNADLAHLVERRLAKAKVAGSSPVIRSIKKESTTKVVLSFFIARLTWRKPAFAKQTKGELFVFAKQSDVLKHQENSFVCH